jgi:hypothetical protein
MKRENQETEFQGRDRKRDRSGWKAQLRTARKAKSKRKNFERGEGKAAKGWN